MKSALEIKKLRCGKGYFTYSQILEALEEKGIKMTKQSYVNKESGERPFSAKEVKALCDILEISLEDGYNFFVDCNC